MTLLLNAKSSDRDIVLNDPVNAVDPEGLWSIGASYYKGLGVAVRFGKSNGKWFIRGDAGVGLGGGVQWSPTDSLPGSSGEDPCAKEGFLGITANLEGAIGPIAGGIEGYAGVYITKGEKGESQVKYVEDAEASGSIQGERGFGIKGQGSFNITGGIAW